MVMFDQFACLTEVADEDYLVGLDDSEADAEKKDARFLASGLQAFTRSGQGIHFYRAAALGSLGPGDVKVPLDTVDASIYPSSSIFSVNVGLARITPQVEGNYLIAALVSLANAVDGTGIDARIRKNGTFLWRGSRNLQYFTLDNQAPVTGALYFNGSTDYIELWASISAAHAIRNSTVATYLNMIKVGGTS